jgi:hypothetical protein
LGLIKCIHTHTKADEDKEHGSRDEQINVDDRGTVTTTTTVRATKGHTAAATNHCHTFFSAL